MHGQALDRGKSRGVRAQHFPYARSAAERDTGRLNPAHPVREQDEEKQRDRQPDAHGEGPHHALALALVGHHEVQRRTQARDDENECDGNEYVHEDSQLAYEVRFLDYRIAGNVPRAS
ncbi:Cytochrome oxidase biogenesis protein Surf1, facilitates heme A insertion [Caballeronia sordidicola]|uniref:Cytochrome oxidase biogenesis protein Surf1, facilitates heme A insertion n=1 Tax=Caballeronia sordidicola TaxID=196367 RepID=A0A242MWQ9_CABSO|nr:Cytochrome oxidase biogenesis protein Surf1, facilitates heme A insertion [Caballeronia sordidicola]